MKKNWNKYFPTEQDLLNALMVLNASENQYPYLVPCGYIYLQSFQKRIRSGKELTEKQMTQLKRLAYEIADKLEKQAKEEKKSDSELVNRLSKGFEP